MCTVIIKIKQQQSFTECLRFQLSVILRLPGLSVKKGTWYWESKI